jgi:hypothetical protein
VLREDEQRGYRAYSTCGDCGGVRYQFFSEATKSWGEMPRHLMGENCIQNLQRRIAALEAKSSGESETSECQDPNCLGAEATPSASPEVAARGGQQ